MSELNDTHTTAWRFVRRRQARGSPPRRRAVARYMKGLFLSCVIILEKGQKQRFTKPRSLFRTRTKYVASSLATMVRKGLVSFYKLRVLGHFGKKGARRRDQPYGGGFFGRWRSSDLRSAKKATPYSLLPSAPILPGPSWPHISRDI